MNKHSACIYSDYIEDIILSLREGLDNPQLIERELKEKLKTFDPYNDLSISNEELNEIASKIIIELTPKERDQLKLTAAMLSKTIKKLAGRSFVQSTSGSLSKTSKDPEKKRSYKVYRIIYDGSRYHIILEKYPWDSQSKKFAETPEVENHLFSKEL